MKKSIFTFLLFVAVLLYLHGDPIVQSNDVIGITGDSITLQSIYSVFLKDYFLMCQPTPGQASFPPPTMANKQARYWLV